MMKYISLLLFSGLIIPVYIAKQVSNHSTISPYKIAANDSTAKKGPSQYISIQEIAEALIPQLKN
ncbi:hypothetical protein [Mucilaginibacter litoreus]